MELTPDGVAQEAAWVHDRGDIVVPLTNRVREELAVAFETSVDPITDRQYHDAIEAVFAEGELAVNVAALVGILRTLDVQDDYPGFVVDELLARELAGMIAGEQPLRLLAEATFHYADVTHHGDGDEPAGVDDLDAALAAGVQTRLPGWNWREGENSFGVESRRS